MGHLAHGPANRGRRVLETAAPLFVCEPPSDPRGGVVLIHGLVGLTHDAEAACRRLASDGWLTVAPFLYHACGGRVFEDLDRARDALSLADLAADVTAAVIYLAGRGCLDTAVIGLGTGAEGFPSLASFASGPGVPLLELPAGPISARNWARVGSFLSGVV